MTNSTTDDSSRSRALKYLSFRFQKKLGSNDPEKINKEIASHLKCSIDGVTNPSSTEVNWDNVTKNLIPKTEFENHEYLMDHNIEYASIWVTPVMLDKAIIDANAEVRHIFKKYEFHDYEHQSQGPDYKIIKKAFLAYGKPDVQKISLYRPNTKQGDPRLWIRNLKKLCLPGEEVAIFCDDEYAYAVNMSRAPLKKIRNEFSKIKMPDDPKALSNFEQFFKSYLTPNAAVLFDEIKKLKGKPLINPARKKNEKHDTDVGMAVESALNIKPNCKKQPDKNGIEIKSFRKETNNRRTLFTLTPNWDVSLCKSMQEFTDKVGYPMSKSTQGKYQDIIKIVGDKNILHCTTRSSANNPQKLKLNVQTEADIVAERHNDKDDLLVWKGEKLRKALLNKHPETFWIECDTIDTGLGGEAYVISKVHYTKSPNVSKLLSLIDQGFITLDHMCTYDLKGCFKERGPSWKIAPNALSMLFPKKHILEI